jgi:hypothetical protein
VWNLLFPQAKYAQKQGLALNLSTIGPPCVSSADQCPRYRFHARRSRQIFAIWATVFGPDRRNRLRFVLSTWTESTAASREILTFEDAYKYADHLGIAGYLSSITTINSAWAAKSVPNVFQELYGALPTAVQKTTAQATVAARYNLTLIAYEGGPGLVENGVIEGGGATGAVTSLLIATARDPSMQVAHEKRMFLKLYIWLLIFLPHNFMPFVLLRCICIAHEGYCPCFVARCNTSPCLSDQHLLFGLILSHCRAGLLRDCLPGTSQCGTLRRTRAAIYSILVFRSL